MGGTPIDDAEILRIQVEALFRHDGVGRITTTNEPEPTEAPRLFVSRSTSTIVWRLRADVPADIAGEIDRILSQDRPLVDLDDTPTVQVELVALLARWSPVTAVFAGPSWYVPAGIVPPGRARPLSEEDLPALRPHFPYLSEHHHGLSPCTGVVADGVAVAVCSSVRITPTACEAGLHTVEAARGRGYGPDAVTAWTAAVRATGRLPLYSTSWDNAPSRRVAAKLSLIQYASSFSVY